LVDNLIRRTVDFEPYAEEIMISRENHDLLQRAIENLPPQRKKIFALCKIEGKSYEEVSCELGISTSTIRDHIVKANKAVKLYFYQNQDMLILLITTQVLKHLK